MRFLFLLFIFSIIMTSCKTPSKMERMLREYNKERDFFDSAELGSGGGKGYFELTTIFNECGEWGGHSEGMKIYSKYGSREFHLDYYKTKVNCDETDQNAGKRSDTVVKQTIELDKKSKRAIINYLEKLVELKVKSKFPGHSGRTFIAAKSDSTLNIELYDYSEKSLKNYNTLLRKLDLEKN